MGSLTITETPRTSWVGGVSLNPNDFCTMLGLVTITDISISGTLTAAGTALSGNTGVTGTLTVTSASASSFTVGRQGATSPALKVDASTASSASGLSIVAAASGAGVAVAAIGGAAEALTLDAKGTGTITIAGTSTGNVVIPRAFAHGTDATDRVVMKGIYMSPANVVVAVPTIANDAAENVDEVAVDVSAAFSIQPAVGDAVIAIPQEALPTDCVFLGAWVSATDTITVSFGSKEGGGGVTGANKNFKFLVIDVT